MEERCKVTPQGGTGHGSAQHKADYFRASVITNYISNVNFNKGNPTSFYSKESIQTACRFNKTSSKKQVDRGGKGVAVAIKWLKLSQLCCRSKGMKLKYISCRAVFSNNVLYCNNIMYCWILSEGSSAGQM